MSAFIVTARRSSAQLLVLRRPRRNAITRATTISRTCCCCTKTTSATITKHRKCPVSSSTTTPGLLLPSTPTRIRLFSTNSTNNSPLPLDGSVVSVDIDDSDSSLQQLDNYSAEEEEEEEDTTTRYFADLKNLHHKTLNRLTQQGFTSMTDIQAMTWDAVLEGKDVVGRSRTGSGKAGNITIL